MPGHIINLSVTKMATANEMPLAIRLVRASAREKEAGHASELGRFLNAVPVNENVRRTDIYIYNGCANDNRETSIKDASIQSANFISPQMNIAYFVKRRAGVRLSFVARAGSCFCFRTDQHISPR